MVLKYADITKGLLKRKVWIGILGCSLSFYSVASDTHSVRDAKVEKELSLLYSETLGDWKTPPKSSQLLQKKITPEKVQKKEEPMVLEKTDYVKIQPPSSDPVPKVLEQVHPLQNSAIAKPSGKEFRMGHVVVGKDGKVNDKKSVIAFKRAATKGDVSAQFNLGLAYEHGWGIKQNLKEASLWYAKASQKGHPGAQLNLGLMFYQGRGVKKDLQLGLEHFRRSANQGNAIAQFNMGNAYWVGEGVTLNESIALEWFKKSAEQGYAVAQYMLGRLYIEGEGLDQNVEEAVMWYARAAAQGLKEAQAALGLAYEKGYGVKANRDEAIRWYNLAAVQGHPGAIARIKIMQGQ